MKPDNKCPKCGGEFEEGLQASLTGAMGAALRVSWGLKVKKILGGLENSTTIKSYRCKSCGYLESYAN